MAGGARRDPDPYRVWLSEIMLQQTTVTAVIPYFDKFVSRFPTVQALAAAPLETVLASWAGLGYYARARNLHACAQAVAARGGFPADLAGLQTLPGIGAYTAAAVGAIAFGIPAVPWTAMSSAWRLGCSRSRSRCQRRSRRCGRRVSASAPRRRRGLGPATSPRRCSTLGRRVCTPAGQPARYVHGSMVVPRGGWGLRRSCRGGHRKSCGRCAMACISG